MFEDKISRVTRSSEQAHRSYNKLSRWYDLIAGDEKQFTKIGLKLLDVKANEKVLEIGFGTGQALVEMAKVGAQVLGVDISEGMLAVAQKRVDAANLSQCIELRIGNAKHLSFENNSLDAVFMSFTLELFDTPEIPIVLAECYRVLHSDGRLAIVALEKKETTACKIYEWGHERFPAFLDCRPIFTHKFIEDAGFKVEAYQEKIMWGLPVAIVLGCKPA